MTGATEEPNEPEQALDYTRIKAVVETIDKVMATEPPHIRWMDSELANKLLHAFAGARTLMVMSLLRSGMPQEEAEERANMQWPLLAFDLGLRVGAELEGARALRDMFGDDMPEWPT